MTIKGMKELQRFLTVPYNGSEIGLKKICKKSRQKNYSSHSVIKATQY